MNLLILAGIYILYIVPGITSQAVIVAGIYDCPKPWIEFEDRCYKYEFRSEGIQGARETCQRDGATLLSVTSLEEHEFVASYLDANTRESGYWFTSGKKESPEANSYFWESSGDPIESYQYWLAEEARVGDGIRIAYHTLGAEWAWTLVREQDENGVEIKNPYICEISKQNIFKILAEERGFEFGTLETDPSKFLMGPIFIRQPEGVIFDKSSIETTSFLECIADGNPDVTYQWYKRKELVRSVIVPLDDNRITITNGKLTVNDPSELKNDNADYDCVATNELGSIRSNTAQLSFGYLNDFPKSNRDPIIVDAFSGAGIECSPPTHGYPSLLYSWYRDDVSNFVRPELKPYTFISNNGKLYFSAVTKDDEGDYHCLVSSPYAQASFAEGKTSLPIPLRVRETIGNEKEPQLASGFPAAFPSSPLQGQNVRLECFAFGTNELFYHWEKVGGPIPAHSVMSDWNRVLTISNIQIVHDGEYKCSVRRREGLSTAGTVKILVESEPFFTIPLKNQHVDKDSQLEWSAIADGVPQVSYKWYRNAVELKIEDMLPEEQDRYTIRQNVLTIADVDPGKDEGMYQLAATNSHGTIYSTAQLRVLSFAPSFIKYPLQQRQYATRRGNTTLICQPEAAPMGEKTWFKNGVLLSASTDGLGRIQQLPNGNLLIKNVNQNDEGEYTCKVKNALGEAESSGDLTVLPTTTISQVPIDTVVKVNKTAIFQCQASFNPALDITYDWYHNDHKIEFLKIRIIGEVPYIEREKYFERGTGINRGALYIYDTQYFHQGLYTCVAMTNSESITKSAKLHVIGPPFPPVGCDGENVGTTSITLTWRMGLFGDNGRPITSFSIEKYDLKRAYWEIAKAHIKGEALKTHRVDIDGLSPFSTYKFRVGAENILGVGDPSKASDFYTTDQAPPENVPGNVSRCVNKVGTLCITWDTIPLAEQNGDGFGYIVQWKKSYIVDEDWTQKTLQGADRNKYVALVGQQNFYKDYDVSVRAFNIKGLGPAPNPAKGQTPTIRSAMGIPTGQPTQLRIWQHNATALLAEWDPVQDTIELMKGKLLGYRINYWRECCETEEIGIFNQVPGQRDSGMIIGLYPDTTYWINAQVYNEAGYGPKTDELPQNTLRAAPKEAPQEVHVFLQGGTSLLVKWRGVSTGITEEPLEGYRVRFWRLSENRYLAEDREAYKKTELIVSGLELDTYYELRVFGYSRGGDGLMSSPIIQFILGPNCYIREDSPDKQYVYKCTASAHIHTSSTTLLVLITLVYFVQAQL